MKGLFLYGANCTKDLWQSVLNLLTEYEITYVEYPHDILRNSNNISVLTKWVYDHYGKEQYDFILGHSMGGLIALELLADYKIKCIKLLLVETNLKPAKEFYRNLLMPEHMKLYGDKVKAMLQSESIYYQESLKLSIQEDFDYTIYIPRIIQPINAIYGDRGQADYVDRFNDLCLEDKTMEQIHFSFIENSCHLPMIENPMGFIKALNNILL